MVAFYGEGDEEQEARMSSQKVTYCLRRRYIVSRERVALTLTLTLTSRCFSAYAVTSSAEIISRGSFWSEWKQS